MAAVVGVVVVDVVIAAKNIRTQHFHPLKDSSFASTCLY